MVCYCACTFSYIQTGAHVLLEASDLLCGSVKELLLLAHLTCLSAMHLRKEITGTGVQ